MTKRKRELLRDELKGAEIELKWKLATSELIPFTEVTKPKFETAAHHFIVARALERVLRGEIDRLMIFMPPRHTKSELATRRFPAFYLGNYPDRFVISASYNSDLATDFGRDVRDIVNDEFYQAIFPQVQLRQDAKAANRWFTNQGGSYVAAGIGTGITGRGAHLGLIDDPFKDRKEAESKTIRDSVWDWYRSSFYTRLMPHAAIVITLTRWHDDDLAGRLIKEMTQGKDQWEIVRLPALAEPGDPMGRVPGQPLWPQWYPKATLQRIKEAIGSYEWLSLYQQRPVAEEGNIFKKSWWRFYREMPPFSFICLSWDTAHEEKKEADDSVCTAWGIHEREIYLFDWFRAKLDYPTLKRKAEALYARHRPNAVLIEDKSSGKPLQQELRKNSVMPVIPIKPEGDKVARAHAVTPIVEGGRVKLPEWASWTDEYIDEMSRFPQGEHDDTVDSTTQALSYLSDKTRMEHFTEEDARALAAKAGFQPLYPSEMN